MKTKLKPLFWASFIFPSPNSYDAAYGRRECTSAYMAAVLLFVSNKLYLHACKSFLC